MENIQNNPPAESSSTNSILLTIVILVLVALGIWFFVGRRPGAPAVPATGGDNGGANANINVKLPGDSAGGAAGTVPSGSGQNDGPAGGDQNGS